MQHYWVRGERRIFREEARRRLPLPPTLAVLDAHRRLRGPYTAAGTLLRQFADDLIGRCPDSVARHSIELFTSAPELEGRLPTAWRSLEWAVKNEERTRFYSRIHTRNIANGLAEVLRDYLAARGEGPRTLVFENAHEADPADQEFISVLLRRTDLAGLVVVVGTADETPADPPGEIDISMVEHLATFATPVDATPVDATPVAVEPARTAEMRALAKEYVDTDGVSDDPELLAAYQHLPETERAELHDDRRRQLLERAEFSLTRGAIPYHAEHGSEPGSTGVQALLDAMRHCFAVGLYQATVEFGLRGRALVEPDSDWRAWWAFTHDAANAMATLGRADEALAFYNEARAASQDTEVHRELSYATGMLYARHYPEPQRDYLLARAYMNQTIVLAAALPESKPRAFQSVFARNGLALVEVRDRRPEEALRLLEYGLARLAEELEPDEHRLHRVVLRYNRAQVYVGMGDFQKALEEYEEVVRIDPNFPEHHFNLGIVLRRLGRNSEALASFASSLEISPPYPEAYYNMADTRMELGDPAGALEDFSRVIQLDPKHIDARINRAGLRCDEGDLDGAWADVTAGLALDPENPYLLALQGRVLAERGKPEEAERALSRALELDASLAEAWALRGVLYLEDGDADRAIADLDRAAELNGTPDILFNRALAYEQLGSLDRAVADYDAILAVADDADAAERRRECLGALSR